MPVTWKTEQILAMAPDASAAKNGQGLATPRKWVSLGHNDLAIWGQCQGSGSKPYQTQIDLGELAFKCSCPSRKFPCKHGLGLFLLLVSQESAFTEKTPPDWVTQWIDSRAQKRTKKSESSGQIVDPVAQAKRASQREAKVKAGVEELERWLGDVVRQGLAAVYGQPYSFWDVIAARMVDAQAPGLARQLRDMAGIASTGAGWQERLLARLGRLHLLLAGYNRGETLPPETQVDVRTLIGWPQNQDEVLAGEGWRDRWLVLGQRVETEEQLQIQRTWLWGKERDHPALILNFSHITQPLDTSLVIGTCLDAELVFFPSAYPLRSLIKIRHHILPIEEIPGYRAIAAMRLEYVKAIAGNPWLAEFPVALQKVIPLRNNNTWVLRDVEGYLLPIAPNFEGGWQLLALSGGYPLTLFGEWNGEYLRPLSVWAENQFFCLG